VPPVAEAADAGSLAGVTVVITGTLDGLTRDEAPRRCSAWAGRWPARVEEDRLRVAGATPGSKYDRALALGIPVLDEAGLGVLLDQGPAAAHDAVGSPESGA